MTFFCWLKVEKETPDFFSQVQITGDLTVAELLVLNTSASVVQVLLHDVGASSEDACLSWA